MKGLYYVPPQCYPDFLGHINGQVEKEESKNEDERGIGAQDLKIGITSPGKSLFFIFPAP